MFRLTYLFVLDVQIYRCGTCESLQTERPYWLDVSYDSALISFGNDIAMRCASVQAWIVYIALVFGLRPSRTRILDYGSGPGLLVRMLRDIGFQACAHEPYARSTIVDGFVGDPSERYEMLVAIETLEHFSEPAEELGRIFAPGHDLIVVRTQPYRGEGPGWYYFFPEVGQHVFFYSHKARQLIARRHGYEVRCYGDMSIFSRRPISALQRSLLDHHGRPLGLLKALLPLVPRPGIARDDALASQRFRALVGQDAWARKLRELAASQERGRASHGA